MLIESSLLLLIATAGFGDSSEIAFLQPKGPGDCSRHHQQRALPNPSGSGELPANAIFTTSFEQDPTQEEDVPVLLWTDEEGALLDFEPVTIVGLPQRIKAYRPKTPLVVGDVLSTLSPYLGVPDPSFRVAEADTSPPTTPQLEDEEVYLDREPRFWEEDPDPCQTEPVGENHHLTFAMRFPKSVHLPTQHMLLLYAAPTRELLANAAEPVFWETMGSGDSTNTLFHHEVTLADANTLRIDAPFCFTVALLDAAGQMSERAEPVCIDPTLRRASNLSGPGEGACALTQSSPSHTAPIIMLGFLLFLTSTRRRRESVQ